MNDAQKRVAEVARSWKEQYFSTAGYGVSPYCASFARYVYLQALGKAGALPVVQSPPHYQRLGLKFPAGMWYADSLAGDEVGPVVPLAQVQGGDLLFFRNTFGDWPDGTITHIGIALDGTGLMADAGSGGLCWVRNHKTTFPGLFVEARRPRCLGAAVKRTLISLDSGHTLALLHGVKAFTQEMEVRYDGRLYVAVNGKEIKRDFVTALVSIPAVAGFAKLFCHDGKVSAFKQGRPAANLSINANLKGAGLHVWVDGKEVKATTVRIEAVGMHGGN